MPPIVVLDTNVWVSAFLNPYGFPATLLRSWTDGAFQVAISAPLMEELDRVLSRPRLMLKYGYDHADLQEYLERIISRAKRITVVAEVAPVRDPKDTAVIETAIRGGALFLVSRDEDLTRDPQLAGYLAARGVSVMTVARFHQYLAEFPPQPT